MRITTPRRAALVPRSNRPALKVTLTRAALTLHVLPGAAAASAAAQAADQSAEDAAASAAAALVSENNAAASAAAALVSESNAAASEADAEAAELAAEAAQAAAELAASNAGTSETNAAASAAAALVSEGNAATSETNAAASASAAQTAETNAETAESNAAGHAGAASDSADAAAVSETNAANSALAAQAAADSVRWEEKGTYSGATAYVENDLVLDQGSTWVALQATTGNAPPTLPTSSNAYWQLVARVGDNGNDGADGLGVPAGGLTGQVLAKASNADNDTEWVDQTGGGGDVESVNGQTGIVVLDADDIDDSATTHKFASSAELSKLAGIASGAEVNVNADWNAVSGDAQILNKPTLGTIASQNAASVSITGGSVTGITDMAVADGGTGRSSHTAYAVLCGGTTTTGAQQSIASVGTSGQVLTSNGAGALPTFQDASSGGQPIPTSSTFPVGMAALLVNNSTTNVNNGATTSGSNLEIPTWIHSQISGSNVTALLNTGAAQTGTWRNISGVALGVGTAASGPRVSWWVRTA